MLSLNASCCHLAFPPDATVEAYVRIRVCIQALAERRRPDLSAVLVLDVSGSMHGEPLAHVAQSAKRVCDLLGDRDALGIVTFNASAGTVATVRPLDSARRRQLRRKIDKLRAGGGTNIGAGLGHAMSLFPPRRRHARHVALLMTDGLPTQGATSLEAVTGLAASAREAGVAVSTLGFGAAHDEDILSAIADAAGGRYDFVPDPRLAEAAFARALGAQRDVVAENLSMTLDAREGVEIQQVLGARRISIACGALKIGLPDAIASDSFELVVKLRLRTPRECGPWQPLGMTLHAEPIGQAEPLTISRPVETVVSRAGTEAIDHEVVAAVAVARAEVARERARRLADAGRFVQAAAVVRTAHAAVDTVPGFVAGDGSRLDEAYQCLHDDVVAYARHPDPETYSAYRKASHTIPCDSTAARAYAERCFEGPIPEAHLLSLNSAEARAIDRHELTIGRSRSCDLAIADPCVTRRHAMVQYLEGAFWAIDLGSSSGTLVNDERFGTACRLHDGDILTVGAQRLQFRLGAP